jgi:hypothetical protein
MTHYLMNSSLSINCPVAPIRRLGGHSRVQRLRQQRHPPARRRGPCWRSSTDLALMWPTPSVDEPVRYFFEHSVRQTGLKSYIRWSSWSSVSSGKAPTIRTPHQSSCFRRSAGAGTSPTPSIMLVYFISLSRVSGVLCVCLPIGVIGEL